MGLFRRRKRAIQIIRERELEELPSGTKEKYIQMGHDFKRHVARLFPPSAFSILDCTKEATKHLAIEEPDGNPDFRIRHIESGSEFCVECKYRTALYDRKLDWSKEYQYDRYAQYSLDSGMPFFVVVGLGGKPESPERMFCFPLNEVCQVRLPKPIFETYERKPPAKPFSWVDGDLK